MNMLLKKLAIRPDVEKYWFNSDNKKEIPFIITDIKNLEYRLLNSTQIYTVNPRYGIPRIEGTKLIWDLFIYNIIGRYDKNQPNVILPL